MPIKRIDWKKVKVDALKSTAFDIASGGFSKLLIRPGPGSFHYFYDTTGNGRLIKNFILAEGPQVATMCAVTIVKKDGRFSPRLRLWKMDKTKPKAGQPTLEAAIANEENILIKANVDTGECHEALWTLIRFLESFKDLELPANAFRVATTKEMALAEALKGHDKAIVLAAVKASVKGGLSERDVLMLVDRKKALERFERLLRNPTFMEAQRIGLKKNGIEAVWQTFFEDHPWIFGYGLKLVSCDTLDDKELEKITTGANVFLGAGKRVDAVMRTRGFIQSLLFAEIKRHETPLLRKTPYRPPDIYQVDQEVAGAVAQVQKTAHKAIKKLEDLHSQFDAEGEFEFDISTIRPRQVVVVGNLEEFASGDSVNVEKLRSFELYRRSLVDIELITFDELFERAKYIVATTEAQATPSLPQPSDAI